MLCFEKKYRLIRLKIPVLLIVFSLCAFLFLSIPVLAGEKTEKIVCFTFDDGPSAITEEILPILEEENIPATFFVIGPDGEKTNKRLKSLVDAGHEIGLHSWCHDYKKIYASADAFFSDLEMEKEWIENVTGICPSLVRFPGGSTNRHADRTVLSSIKSGLAERNLSYFDWNADGKDSLSSSVSAEEIEAAILHDAKGKEVVVVLLHDSSNRKTTPEALSLLIRDFREKGYRFCRLSELSGPVCF